MLLWNSRSYQPAIYALGKGACHRACCHPFGVRDAALLTAALATPPTCSCPTGYETRLDGPGATSCTPVAAGFFALQPNTAISSPCPPGTYADGAGELAWVKLPRAAAAEVERLAIQVLVEMSAYNLRAQPSLTSLPDPGGCRDSSWRVTEGMSAAASCEQHGRALGDLAFLSAITLQLDHSPLCRPSCHRHRCRLPPVQAVPQRHGERQRRHWPRRMGRVSLHPVPATDVPAQHVRCQHVHLV